MVWYLFPVPHKPTSVIGTASGPNSIKVSWNSPELRTGPTNYTVLAVDTVDDSLYEICYVQGFLNTSCNVENLDEFWNYTISVTAITVNGTNSSDVTDPVQTQQAAPGPVQSVRVVVQQDVTKPRTANVTWELPSERERNGIINHYYVRYLSQKTQSLEVQVPGTFLNNIQLEAEQNYTFEVFAETVANGTIERIYRFIPAGAPQQPDEDKEPLVKIGPYSAVTDGKKQIAINLPLTYLCNTSNGVHDRWGVIVAEESVLTSNDVPFRGSRSSFDNSRLHTYLSWFQVNNFGSFEPYIAFRSKQGPDCSNNLLSYHYSNERAKRAVKSRAFVVGHDGNCVGVTNTYCNGYLRPGRSYQVRIFVCTEGGCTETRYSDPIITESEEPEESPVILIIVGALVAIFLFAIVVFAFIVWKKHLLCFKQGKSLESGTENPGYSPDIEMSDIPYRPVKLANFPEYVEDMQKDSNLRFSEQYKAIRRLSPAHTTNAAEGQSARIKNRYTNILPFDHSRVKLLPLDDEEGSDYINANYMPGYHSKREYIAAQGPLQCTKDDFWRMVWEQNVSVIVMLTQCVERGRRKCESYWPDTPHEPVYFGDIIVETDSESTLPDYVIRIMNLKLGAKKRKIKLIHFLKWPDFGCPETTWLLLDFVMACRLYKPHDTQGPIIVHCSAGVGRTGTFIALDHLLYRIKDHDEVDIFNIVLEMRNYRPSMVQTEDQYIFIHECISDYLCAEDEDEDLQREEVDNYLAEALYENVPRS